MSNKKKRNINEKLIHTWESMEMIEQQYIDNCDYYEELSKKQQELYNYLFNLDYFERMVMFLYAEYGSYRKVADETNIGKDTIATLIGEIKLDIKLKINICF
jgi:hypothetical protein